MGSSYQRKMYRSTIRELANSPTTKDRIRAYILDGENVKLTPKEEELKERWSAAFSLLLNYHSPSQACKVMMEKYALSESQAFRDIRNAQEIYGDATKSNREAYRSIVLEMAMKCFQLAASKGDLSEMNRSVLTITKILGLDRDHPNLPDFSQMFGNTIMVDLEDQQKKMLQKLIQTGNVNLNTSHERD